MKQTGPGSLDGLRFQRSRLARVLDHSGISTSTGIRHGLVCGSACACMGPDRDLRGTPKQQKTGLDYMMKIIDQMVVLDCPSLREAA